MDPEEDKPEDVNLNSVGAKYLKMVNSVFFLDTANFTVELPVLEHWQPEVKEAKDNEVSNLLDYDVFEGVEDNSQDTFGSRLVVTAKEKQNPG